MIQPERAIVRPRAFAPGSGESLLLEDEVRPFVEAGAPGLVGILGPAGSGKSVALRHLAAVLPASEGVLFLDDPGEQEFYATKPGRLVIYAVREEREGFYLGLPRLASY